MRKQELEDAEEHFLHALTLAHTQTNVRDVKKSLKALAQHMARRAGKDTSPGIVRYRPLEEGFLEALVLLSAMQREPLLPEDAPERLALVKKWEGQPRQARDAAQMHLPLPPLERFTAHAIRQLDLGERCDFPTLGAPVNSSRIHEHVAKGQPVVVELGEEYDAVQWTQQAEYDAVQWTQQASSSVTSRGKRAVALRTAQRCGGGVQDTAMWVEAKGG